MQVEFREINFFDLWIWVEFSTMPSHREKQLVEEVFDSWFFLGKLGGFNAENIQVQEAGSEIGYIEYDTEAADNSLMALMHNMSEFEYEGTWGRCWFDLGTTDALALDILVNALKQLSKEYVDISRLIVGGENEDWAIDPSRRESVFSE